MSRGRIALIAVWLAIIVAAGAQVGFGLRVDSDIAAFLPQARTSEQALLLSELRGGEASRIWLLMLTGETPSALANASARFADELRTSGIFARVFGGALSETSLDTRLQELILERRYLLDPEGASQFASSSLRRAFEDGLERLRSPMSPFDKQLLIADPTGALQRTIDNFKTDREIGRRDGIWMSNDETRAFLVAQTTSSGTDLEAQEAAARAIAAAFHIVRADHDVRLVQSGPPAIAVATKANIQTEVLVLSFASLALLIAILFFVYRRLTLVLLMFVPILTGVLIGASVTSLIWGSVHGISLAFGATLLGVALDYPIHVVSHTNGCGSLLESATRIWPTLRLGVLTTVLGFSAMLTADFPGIEQLAVFSISGLICAALMTRYLIAPLAANPGLLAPRLREVAAVIDRFGPRIAWLAPLIVVAALAAAWHDPRAVFASDIGDLSPIPTDLLARDQELRLAMGMAESSHILEVRGSDLEAVLEQQERLAPTLEEAVHAGALRDFQMAASILPSASTQRARQAALPTAAVLTARVVEAQQGLPYRDGVFAPFIADVETARRSAVLDASALSGTELGIRFASLVREEAGTAIGTIALNGLTQAAGLQAVIDRSPSENITMIDLKGSANALVNAYRDETLFRSSLALLVIAIILIVALRNWRRVAMVMIPVLGSVLTAAAIPILFGQPLNVFHLVSLLLVVGIGLDYALFFSRPTADPAESLSTRHSLLVCTLSTGTVFAVLSLSRIPVLSSIGSTVAVGTVTAFILSALLAARSHREAT